MKHKKKIVAAAVLAIAAAAAYLMGADPSDMVQQLESLFDSVRVESSQ